MGSGLVVNIKFDLSFIKRYFLIEYKMLVFLLF